MTRTWALLCSAVALAGCREPATAMTVCAQLATAGVAANCERRGVVGGTGAAERVVFDSPRAERRVGEVVRFVDPICVDATMRMVAPVAGMPRRYCSRSSLIFVELTTTAAGDLAKTARIVEPR